MKTKLIQIGRSRGIRLTKAIIDQVGLESEVNMQAQRGVLTIWPAGGPRAGWEEACKEMRDSGEDELLDATLPPLSSFDASEWEW